MGLFIVIALIIVAFWALIVAKWADNWGHSAYKFYILAFLLSPIIASAILLVSGKKDGGKNNKKCPQCAEYIQIEAIVCKYCGHQYDLTHSNSDIQEEDFPKTNWGIIYIVTALFILALVLLLYYIEIGQYNYTKSSNHEEKNMVVKTKKYVDKYDFTGIADVDSNVVSGLAPIMLRIVSIDSVRVRVVVISDEGKSVDHTFQRIGEEATYKAFGQFSLRISKTRSVAIYLGDQLLQYLGPENTWVSRAIINKQGIIDGMTILRERN